MQGPAIPIDDESAETGEQDAPEESPEMGDVVVFGEMNQDLPQCLKDALSDAFQTLQGREAYDRRIEVLTDRLHRFYDDGIQHVYPNYGTGTYQIGSPRGSVNVGSDSFNCPDYIGAYNIFYPIGRSLDAVLTQNPPGIDFRPDDPSRGPDMEAAETAEGYRHYFDQANDVKDIQQKISRMFRLSGRTVLENLTVEDEQKWGLNDSGKPRRMETTVVYGTLESKVPILAKGIEGCAYCFLYSDPDILMAKEDYPWVKGITGGQGGLGESEWERYARVGVQQARKGYFLTGNSGAHITTKIKGYLRPAVFGKYKDLYEPTAEEDPEFTPDGKMTVGEYLKTRVFPDGCCATYIGKNYACADNASMDDHIVIGFPKERDGMSGGALMRDCVVLQDVFNDYKNAERSYYEKAWPSLWIHAEDAEYDAVVAQAAEPAAIRQLKSKGNGEPASNSFYREPDMQLPTSFTQEVINISGPLIQMISGALPSLQGENDPDNKTASGKAMDRSQAMGMLGMSWASMQRMFARMYYQAALLAAKNPDHSQEIVVPGENSTNSTLRLENLTKGKFSAHPDTDSSFPESTAAKRANLQQIITMLASNQQMAQIFWQSPDNWEQALELMGFPELELIPAEAYKKQVREFELLLREAPVPDMEATEQAVIQHAAGAIIAEQSGQPVPPAPEPVLKSSVPIGEFDYHQWEFAKCQEWLSSEACWRQLAEGNLKGIQNITLHTQAHQAAMQQQAMAAAQAQQQMKPPSEAINFKDESPEGQSQMNKQAGITTAPEANAQVQKNAAPPSKL